MGGGREVANRTDHAMRLVDECRTFMSGFPTGVAVVSGVDAQGQPRGVTCSSLISVTVDPPILMVSLSTRSGTLEAIRRLGAFGVNQLPGRAKEIAQLFASGRPDRFQSVRWQPRGRLGLPWLVDHCRGWAECAVREILMIEDHALVVGDAVDICSTSEAPLLHGFRGFATWQAAL